MTRKYKALALALGLLAFSVSAVAQQSYSSPTQNIFTSELDLLPAMRQIMKTTRQHGHWVGFIRQTGSLLVSISRGKARVADDWVLQRPKTRSFI